MLPLDEARDHVLDRIHAAAPRPVLLADAAGLVLADAVVATETVPPFDNTAMDGFAVIAADTVDPPNRLRVTGTVAAGAAATDTLRPGDAMRIMTGAPMPPGADAVVMVERTTYDEAATTVDVEIEVPPGNHVRGAGEDVLPGDVLYEAGTVLTAGHLGVLASVGVPTVDVIPRPVVGVVSTGDELVDDGRPLEPGEIRDSNRRTLLTLLEESGFTAVDLGLARDDEAEIERVFRRGVEECDAVLSSGGVSMGAFDYVKVVLDRIGDMRWMQIAIKPAKPFAFGLVGDVPVFGLPGNPVSSMVSYELFARPALRKMAGCRRLERPRRIAVSDDALGRHDDGKTHFLRVDGGPDDFGRWRIRKLGGQGSHQLTAMARATALAVVPDGVDIREGDEVEIIPLGTLDA
ncbi:MAG: molybdopterin molybdotransferase MoeA [Acidimicrobiales bacterium]|nr:molybdopterin molybdotransferase MoeA [Acidimicrobiales bacterium]